jgi:hypothetical protein
MYRSHIHKSFWLLCPNKYSYILLLYHFSTHAPVLGVFATMFLMFTIVFLIVHNHMYMFAFACCWLYSYLYSFTMDLDGCWHWAVQAGHLLISSSQTSVKTTSGWPTIIFKMDQHLQAYQVLWQLIWFNICCRHKCRTKIYNMHKHLLSICMACKWCCDSGER